MPVPSNPVAEFASYARLLMLKRDVEDAERLARSPGVPDRVQRLLTRSAVGAGSLADLGTDYAIMVSGFSASLRTKSIFARMLDDNAFVRAPLRTRLGLITSNGAVGAAVAEGASVPLSKIVLPNTVLRVRKAAAMICMTRELAEHGAAGGLALFSKELQNATASAVDSVFLAAVLESGTGDIINSSGSTAVDSATDLRAALGHIDLGADSKLYWLGSPRVAVLLSTLTSTTGVFVHAAASPLGGELLGLPFLTSDAVLDDELHLIDASSIAADFDTVELLPSGQGDVLMQDGTPPMNSTQPLAAQIVSLFQTNSVALRSTVYFGCERLRGNATVTITNIS